MESLEQRLKGWITEEAVLTVAFELPKNVNNTFNRGEFTLERDRGTVIRTNNQVLVQSRDKRTFYDLSTGKEAFTFPTKIENQVIKLDGRFLVKDEAGKVFYDLETGKEAVRLQCEDDRATHTFFTVGGKVLGQGWDLFDLRTGRMVFDNSKTEGLIHNVIEVDGKILVQVIVHDIRTDHDIKTATIFYDIETQKQVLNVKGQIHGQAQNIDGKCLMFNVDLDAFLDLKKRGKIAYRFPERVYGRIYTVGDRHFVLSAENHCTLYELETGKEAIKFPQAIITNDYWEICMHNIDGRTVVQGKQNPNTFYDLRTGEIAIEFPQPVHSHIREANGRLIVQGTDNKTFYDFRTGAQIAQFPRSVGYPFTIEERLVVSPDFRTFYDFNTQKISFELAQNSPDIAELHSVNGKTLAQGTNSSTFYTINFRNVVRAPVRELERLV